MGRRITILGMGLTMQAARFAPQLLDGTEVWGMNDGMTAYPYPLNKFDRWFELHSFDYLTRWRNTEKFGGLTGYIRAIESLKKPCYTLDKSVPIKSAVAYPQDEIAIEFGLGMFDGTPSRMLALACYEHHVLGKTVDHIQSYGIDMLDAQHAPQRPCWAIWLAFAHCLGIETGGTAWDFLGGAESDVGIAVDRRMANKKIAEHKLKQEPQREEV